LAENPSITVQVLADIKALTTGMKEGERIVGQTTATMAQSVDKADLGNRFAKQAQGFTKAAGAMTFALQEFDREGANVISRTEAIGQSLMMTGSKFGAVGGSMVQLGIALNEVFTGTQAAARAMAEEVATMESKSRFQAETRDLERQLDILKETDPVKKAELEMARELAKIRREAIELDAKGADAAAREMIRAKELLAIEQGRQKIEEARNKAAKDAAQVSQAGAVGSITTSLGGTFNFAQNAILNGIQSVAIKQHAVQQNILAAAKDILNVLRNGGVAIT
jgi:hypothetical protein